METLRSIYSHWTAFTAKFPLETREPVWVPEPNPSVAILFVFNKNGQTSQEVQSLAMQSVLAFSGYPHVVKECHEPDQSPSGQLPYMITTTGKALAGREIIDEVLDKVPEFGSCLTPIEKADALAFTSLGESKLHFGLIFDLWFNPRNWENVALPKYSNDHPWPLNKILPRIKRHEQLDWMLKQRVSIDKEEILDDVKTALSAYATQLDQKQYLFGSKPTLADAVLFAYLHILLSTFTAPTGTHSSVRDIIKRHDNLIQYSRRIWSTWFATPKK
ncbi:UNVERIFIED_CONTAM: Metaxin-2 [Siphonaria sp. JEL0065]|nr:Metaxin-2 [Siphonaria sp. JEL0065]